MVTVCVARARNQIASEQKDMTVIGARLQYAGSFYAQCTLFNIYPSKIEKKTPKSRLLIVIFIIGTTPTKVSNTVD